jgi:hypothetical protein
VYAVVVGHHSDAIDDDQVLTTDVLVRHRPGAGAEVHCQRAQTRQLAGQALHSYVVWVVEERAKLVRDRIAFLPCGVAERVHGLSPVLDRWVGGRIISVFRPRRDESNIGRERVLGLESSDCTWLMATRGVEIRDVNAVE